MNCEFCGSNIPAGASNCPACGAACTPSGRVCVFCGGNIIKAKATECPRCGSYIKCTVCGHEFKQRKAICPKCEETTVAFETLKLWLKPEQLEKKEENISDSYENIRFWASIISNLGVVLGVIVFGVGVYRYYNRMPFMDFVWIFLIIGLVSIILDFPCKWWLKRKEPEAIEKLEMEDSEYQSILKRLKEDDSFFQTKFQEFVIELEKENAEEEEEEAEE